MVSATENQSHAQSTSPNSKEASPSKATTEPTLDEQKAEAFAALATGKRHLLVEDIPLAVTSLGESCELLSKLFGDTGTECGEAYFYYGKALLEMARRESGVLGNALDGVPEGDDQDSSQVEDPEKMTEEEKDDVEDKVEQALEENFEKHDKIAKIHNGDDVETEEESSVDEQEEGAEKDDAEKPIEGVEVMDAETKDAESEKPEEVEGKEAEGEDEAAQDAEDEEDPSNLQLAWEMLELAKVVFVKQLEEAKDIENKDEIENRLCETYLVLGEVSIENENYLQATEDLSICLKKQTESLSADSRSIAETHYQLGIAQGFDMKWEEAVVSLNAAISVIQARIVNLSSRKEVPEAAKELVELEALIPEIKEKITDTNEMKAESIRKMKEAVGFTSGSSSNGSSSSTIATKPISSISVKRKVDDEKDGESKKIKENGDGCARDL